MDQITWSHKLAPETVNLAATKQVAEIQVFRITARTASLDRPCCAPSTRPSLSADLRGGTWWPRQAGRGLQAAE
ncbi:hypothetical protein ACTTAI_00760 (plasmid) [Rhodobacter capsulatus]|uniref:hypothetical protein n=1 Tax=Rhodobacter capsulatus TaxID=1061 RepID=UPI0040299FE8